MQLQIANQKHDVVAIQVYDPRAKVLPDVGLLKVMDAETGHEMYIDTSSKKLRMAHTQQWLMQQENLKTDFAKSKVDWIFDCHQRGLLEGAPDAFQAEGLINRKLKVKKLCLK